MRLRITAPRIIAGLLAIGGIYWGVLLSPWLSPDNIRFLVVFGPGYSVTAAYVVRATTAPPLRWRQVIWVLSILVQGGWLACHVIGTLATGGIERLLEPGLPVAWWFFATVASVVALKMESALA